MRLLVDDLEARSFVGLLRRRVADQHRDLRAAMAETAAFLEDRLEEMLDVPPAALLGARRDPFDDPETVRGVRDAGHEGRGPLVERFSLEARPAGVPQHRRQRLEEDRAAVPLRL